MVSVEIRFDSIDRPLLTPATRYFRMDTSTNCGQEGISLAKGRLHFLADAEIRRIHETSIRILEDVGVAVHSPSTVRLLEEHGARVSEQKRVHIPRELVVSALASAPKSVLLAAQDRKLDLRIPSERLFVTCGGQAAFVKNLISGDSRYCTTEDLRDFAIFVERLPQIDFMWMIVGALDQPQHLKDLVELKTCLEFTTKHVQTMPSSAESAVGMIRLASTLSGGREELEKRPLFSAVQCPVSPLTFEKGLTESQVEFARAGIPVVAMVAAVAGLTAPVTLSGTIAQTNAENLASLVISQASRKGAPWIYSSDSSAGNLRTGSIDYGTFETQLIRAGAGQMGRFYGLPTMVAALGLEETTQHLSSVHEGVPFMVVQSLPESDLASGLGGVDQAASASFEQLLVDAWVWEVAREFPRTFVADDDAISYDTISAAGVEGTYLKSRHTISRFKDEFASISKSDAVLTSYQENGTKGSLLRKAYEKSRLILSEPKTPVISKRESETISRELKNSR